MTAIVREIQPTIVLLPSLNDYMEDHTNTARLVITACFSRAMRHYTSIPPREPTAQDVYLYHAQPHTNRDGMRTLVVPELFVDISGVMDTKLQMLGCHESQRQWLDETQGLDDYLRDACGSRARKSRGCDPTATGSTPRGSASTVTWGSRPGTAIRWPKRWATKCSASERRQVAADSAWPMRIVGPGPL